MKKLNYLFVSLFLFGSVGLVSAAGLVGSCGSGAIGTECHISDLGGVIKSGLFFMLGVSMLFLLAIIVYTGFRFIVAKDKPGELKDARDRLVRVVIGVALLTAVVSVSVYTVLLSDLGVKSQFLEIFKIFNKTSSLPSYLFQHAYADQLPNPLNVETPYELLLKIITLLVRWFVYPLIVFYWFFTGFLFVKAQGNPGELQKAKGYLLWTFIGTVVVLMAQGFAFAIRDTVNQIFSS